MQVAVRVNDRHDEVARGGHDLGCEIVVVAKQPLTVGIGRFPSQRHCLVERRQSVQPSRRGPHRLAEDVRRGRQRRVQLGGEAPELNREPRRVGLSEIALQAGQERVDAPVPAVQRLRAGTR